MSNLERCGIVMKSGEVIELHNAHPDPENNFMILEENLVDPEVMGTFHTHPKTGPNLSVQDYYGFLAYPKLLHFIVAHEEIWCFHTINGILCRYENIEIPRLLRGFMP